MWWKAQPWMPFPSWSQWLKTDPRVFRHVKKPLSGHWSINKSGINKVPNLLFPHSSKRFKEMKVRFLSGRLI